MVWVTHLIFSIWGLFVRNKGLPYTMLHYLFSQIDFGAFTQGILELQKILKAQEIAHWQQILHNAQNRNQMPRKYKWFGGGLWPQLSIIRTSWEIFLAFKYHLVCISKMQIGTNSTYCCIFALLPLLAKSRCDIIIYVIQSSESILKAKILPFPTSRYNLKHWYIFVQRFFFFFFW